MSYPRKIHPGKTYMITRRTLRRYFLLRPDEEMKELIEYSLAMAANLYKMEVHAFCAMSTHIHVVLTDTRGLLPMFLASFHRLVAMGTKALRQWDGSVWERIRRNRRVVGRGRDKRFGRRRLGLRRRWFRFGRGRGLGA